jgi:NAD(P)-dependent dehydrogenase (short-subunit alcohol dehydrogenase family)
MPTAIVTGANRGIGLEFCRQLSTRGYEVSALCRSSSEALDALPVEVVTGFDVTDEAAVEKFATGLKPHSVDLLINNAGILRSVPFENVDADKIRELFEVNALAPLLVTTALLPALKDGAKIALITSRMGSIADNTSGGSYGYRMSKSALNAAGASLAHDLAPRDISVAILHPGYVRTDMTSHNGLIDADESVRGMLKRIDELNSGNSGTFWHTNGEVLPW